MHTVSQQCTEPHTPHTEAVDEVARRGLGRGPQEMRRYSSHQQYDDQH